MTANPAHVAAVEAAMDADIAGYCERKHNNPPNNRRMSTVAVETLTPLIRAEVAEAIRAEARLARAAPDGRHPDVSAMTHAAALRYAARIAEGES